MPYFKGVYCSRVHHCRVCGHDGPHGEDPYKTIEYWNKTNQVGWEPN